MRSSAWIERISCAAQCDTAFVWARDPSFSGWRPAATGVAEVLGFALMTEPLDHMLLPP